MPRDRPDAVVLLGPTGAGKSPLGHLLEARGLAGRACRHVDFGERLRAAAADEGSLAAHHREVARAALAEGRLLRDDEDSTALALLAPELTLGEDAAAPVLVLNGLPRHQGQAVRLAPRVRVRLVAHLAASAEVVRLRILRDTGGDRAQRRDDGAEAVAARVARFETHTRPLLAHYRAAGVPVLDFPVGPDTSARDLLGPLEAAWVRTSPGYLPCVRYDPPSAPPSGTGGRPALDADPDPGPAR